MADERITRSKSYDDETLIQKVVEKVLANKSFLDKLLDTFKDVLKQNTESIKLLHDKVSSLEGSINKTEKSCNKLEDQIELQEQYSRSNNLRIFGIKEAADEDIEKVVTKFCQEKLDIKITALDIDICHRLQSKKDSPKPILVKFVRRSVKNRIFAVKKRLKGTNITIREDLTMKRLSIVKTLSTKYQSKNVFTTNGNIFVKIDNSIRKIRYLSDYYKLDI